MNTEKIFDELSKEKIVESIIDNFEQFQNENKSHHEQTYVTELKVFDKIIIQYLCLHLSIDHTNQSDSFQNRAFYTKHYLSTITNNFYVLRQLFLSGYHIQFQILLRSQFEFINTLICFVGDDDFFRCYVMAKKNGDIPITPKHSNTEKCLKRLLKEYDQKAFDDIWDIYSQLLKTMHSALSEIVHGNVARIMIQGFQKNDEENLYHSGIGGTTKPLGVTQNILIQIINYFQITFSLIDFQLQKRQLININTSFIKFLRKNYDYVELLSVESR